MFIKIIDKNYYSIETKLDIGVYKDFDIEQDEYLFDLSILDKQVSLLISSKEQIFTEKLKSLLKMGARSTRYKDIFDFYYLINETNLDKKRLYQCFVTFIFLDENMRENNITDISNRLSYIFDSRRYKLNLNSPKVNWLDISVEKAISSVLEFIESLENVTVSS